MRSTLVERLTAARKARGHSQEAAAHAIGVTLATLARWESGISCPTGLSVAAIEAYVAHANEGSEHG